MTTELKELKEVTQGILSFYREDTRYMGIHLPGKSLKWAQEEFRKNKNIHGWIVKEGALDTWKILGYIEIDEKIYMYGPYIEGEWFQNMETKGLSRLEELAEALDILEEKSIISDKFYPQGILFTKDGELLFLPEMLTKRVIKTLPENEESEIAYHYEMMNHPDYKGGRNAGYAIASILYNETTGSYPYEITTIEEYHDKIREQELVSPKNINPEIKESFSTAIMKSLGKAQSDSERRNYLILREWKEKLDHFIKTGTTTDISAEDREAWKEEGEILQKKYTAGYKQKVFFRNNGKLVVAMIALAAIALYLVGGYILKQLEPPKTLGFSPRQVVLIFYNGINSSDYYSMRDCVTDDAGKEKLQKAGEIRAFTGIRIDQEQQNRVMDAQLWVKNGREKGIEFETVYGIADLKIEEIEESHFRVSYESWLPDYEEKEDGGYSSFIDGKKIVESVYLEDMGNHWRINKIEEISSQDMERIYFIR